MLYIDLDVTVTYDKECVFHPSACPKDPDRVTSDSRIGPVYGFTLIMLHSSLHCYVVFYALYRPRHYFHIWQAYNQAFESHIWIAHLFITFRKMIFSFLGAFLFFFILSEMKEHRIWKKCPFCEKILKKHFRAHLQSGPCRDARRAARKSKDATLSEMTDDAYKFTMNQTIQQSTIQSLMKESTSIQDAVDKLMSHLGVSVVESRFAYPSQAVSHTSL